MKGCVVLVHGYLRQGFNMRYLARGLKETGYATLSPTLPTVFGNVATCSTALASFLESNHPVAVPVHFVGHSMGGLIIRHYLSLRNIPNLGRVVLIGVPNGGSAQSRCVMKKFPPLRHLSPALQDLAEPGPRIGSPLNMPPPEIGIIAGTDSKLFPAQFLCKPKGENDGRVTTTSARLAGATAEILLPLNHVRLHWNPETVTLIDRFLNTGRFSE